MTTATLTGIDVRLRNDVRRQLDWDPEVDDSDIGVTAKDGVVTLTGFIDSCAAKLAAERVVKRVRGVRAVANDLVIRGNVGRTDTDIATDAMNALRLRAGMPEQVQVVVHNGCVTLTGTAEWYLQKVQAADIVEHIRGVRAVMNHIDVAPGPRQRNVRRRIVAALHRSADLDASHIDVTVNNDAVTLTGTVHTWSQRQAAEEAATRAPGIRHVDNQIVVGTR